MFEPVQRSLRRVGSACRYTYGGRTEPRTASATCPDVTNSGSDKVSLAVIVGTGGGEAQRGRPLGGTVPTKSTRAGVGWFRAFGKGCTEVLLCGVVRGALWAQKRRPRSRQQGQVQGGMPREEQA